MGISGKRSHDYYLEEGNTIIAAFQKPPSVDNSSIRKKQYYRLNSDLQVMSEQLAELDAKRFVFSKSEENVGNTRARFMKHFPFFERHFFIPAQNNHFYTVDSRDFLVKKFDSLGNYMHAFYHPYTSPEVTREDALKSTNDFTESIAEQIELPEYWPAFNAIFLDDENRFWVSTITESDEYFQWWVLEESGEPIAKFKWPGDHYQDPANLDNHILVKDGYFYQREEDEQNDQVSIVRYKIEFYSR